MALTSSLGPVYEFVCISFVLGQVDHDSQHGNAA